jgi:hypothetical protein
MYDLPATEGTILIFTVVAVSVSADVEPVELPQAVRMSNATVAKAAVRDLFMFLLGVLR